MNNYNGALVLLAGVIAAVTGLLYTVVWLEKWMTNPLGGHAPEVRVAVAVPAEAPVACSCGAALTVEG